jgi:hypothetical protein
MYTTNVSININGVEAGDHDVDDCIGILVTGAKGSASYPIDGTDLAVKIHLLLPGQDFTMPVGVKLPTGEEEDKEDKKAAPKQEPAKTTARD